MVRPEDIGPDQGKIGLWYYGTTGCGKTFAATTEYPDSYRKCANNKWWDGYQDETSVLIDDLDKSHHYMGFHLKIWADRYSFIAETKGSSRYVRPEKIIVTSNWHPNEIWSEPQTLEPILRRFKVVKFQSLNEAVGFRDNEHAVHETRPYRDLPVNASVAPNFVIPRPLEGVEETKENEDEAEWRALGNGVNGSIFTQEDTFIRDNWPADI